MAPCLWYACYVQFLTRFGQEPNTTKEHVAVLLRSSDFPLSAALLIDDHWVSLHFPSNLRIVAIFHNFFQLAKPEEHSAVQKRIASRRSTSGSFNRRLIGRRRMLSILFFREFKWGNGNWCCSFPREKKWEKWNACCNKNMHEHPRYLFITFFFTVTVNDETVINIYVLVKEKLSSTSGKNFEFSTTNISVCVFVISKNRPCARLYNTRERNRIFLGKWTSVRLLKWSFRSQ